MIVKDLVRALDKVNGILPVKFLREGRYTDVREGYSYDPIFQVFSLTTGNIDYLDGDRDLDTLFLMHIIDYCNELIGGSLFNEEFDRFVSYRFEVFEYKRIDNDTEEMYGCEELKVYIKNIEGETCFIIEASDEFCEDDAIEVTETIEG